MYRSRPLACISSGSPLKALYSDRTKSVRVKKGKPLLGRKFEIRLNTKLSYACLIGLFLNSSRSIISVL